MYGAMSNTYMVMGDIERGLEFGHKCLEINIDLSLNKQSLRIFCGVLLTITQLYLLKENLVAAAHYLE